MKRALIAAAALLVFAFASPALALTRDEAQQIVKSSGCDAKVYMFDSEQFNAYYAYDPYTNEEAIVAIGFNNLTEPAQRLILYHETWHCLQVHVYGWPDGHDREWDADWYAIKRMAEEGVDGAELNAQLWAWIYNTYGFTGDDNEVHGLLTHRVTRGWLNQAYFRLESA